MSKTILTIELSEEAAAKLLANPPKELAGFRVESIQRVPVCPICNQPTHASESNDDNVCAACLGDAAILPVEHVPITADTITNKQIRELGGTACTSTVRRLCKIALNDAVTYLRAEIVRDARARCAEILNARLTAQAGKK